MSVLPWSSCKTNTAYKDFRPKPFSILARELPQDYMEDYVCDTALVADDGVDGSMDTEVPTISDDPYAAPFNS